MPAESATLQHQSLFLSPARLLGTLVVSVFIIEALLMLLLYALPPMPGAFIAFLDALLLSILLFPVFYLFAFRPLRQKINELWLAKSRLQSSHERLQFLSSATSVTLYACRPGGDFGATFVSDNVTALAGFQPREFIEDPAFWMNHVHPEDRQRVLANLPRLFEQEHYSHEYRFQHRDGTYRWMRDELRVVRDRSGQPVELAGIWTDMTACKQLEIQRERCFRFFNLSPGLQCIAGPDGFFKMVSPAFTSTLGYTESELLGKPFLEFIAPEDRQATLNEVERQLRGNPTFNFKNRYVCKDGTLRLFSWDAFLNPGDGMLYAVARDIIEQEQTAETLRQSESRLRLLLDSVAEAIYGVDLNGNCTFCNPSCLHLLGYTRADELIGRNMHQLIHHKRPDGTPLAAEACRIYQAFAQGKGTHVDDEVFWRADGTPFRVEYRSYPQLQDGAAVGAVITFLDITERALAQEKLLKLSRAVENSPASVVITDTNGTIEYVNRKFAEVTGYTAREALGQNPKILKSGIQSAEFYGQLWTTILAGNEWRGEICNKKKNGEIYVEQASISPVLNDNGMVTHFVAVKEDITERKRNEDALRELNERLEQRVEQRTRELEIAKAAAESASLAKSQFLSSMSHEIRTPMNSVLGMTHLALRTDLNPRQRDYLQKIQHSGEHLLGIIDDILDFSKIEAGKLNMEAIDFRLSDVIENLFDLIAWKTLEKGIKFTVDIGPALSLPLRADPLRLEQILINLANNAVKFTDKGEISIRARRMEEDETAMLLRFEVRDSGSGISAEDQLKLFQSFRQADASTTRKYGGTGLGLAICKQLVQMMEGEIGVNSEPGCGSTFWFTVRLGKGSPEGGVEHLVAAAGQAEALAAIRGAHVLLAEDNQFNQQVATELLEDAGVIVCVANNGEEALDMLQQERFDCVLMDVQMPEMDGLEATRRIRAQPALAGLRVIAMTASAQTEDKMLCLAAGMDDFISKPVLPDMLYATLAKWVTGRTLKQPRTVERRSMTAGAHNPDGAALLAVSAGTGQREGCSIIDLEVLAGMVNNDPVKMRKFALKFVASTQGVLNEINTALEHQDMKALAILGHRIKLPARTVGAQGFADLCQALEQCRRKEDMMQARSIVARLHTLLEQASAQIGHHLSAQ